LKKFEELWEQSADLNEEYVSTLKNETWIREDIKPYELYLKFLFEYFSEEINEDKTKVNISDLPEGFIAYKYQLDAVNQAKRMLAKYNGVFLADVVGLGKTYITALLARELYEGRKLVICPPVLKNYWEEVLRDFGVVAKVVSLGKLDEKDNLERTIILLNISRTLFTHSLPMPVIEECFRKIIKRYKKSFNEYNKC